MATKAPVAPKTAKGFADDVLLDDEGNEVRMGELWEGGPVVLVWLRHYG